MKVRTDIGSIDRTKQKSTAKGELHVTLSKSAPFHSGILELTVPEASVPAVEI